MKNSIDDLIASIETQVSSGNFGSLLAAIGQLEGLTAAADSGVRKVWTEWRQSKGPIGDVRLSVLARRSLLRQLLAEARHTARTLQASLRFANGKMSIDVMAQTGATMSHREIHEALQNALAEAAGSNLRCWIIDVWPDNVIYEESNADYTGETRLYRRDYSISVDETVTLGDPVAVERQISYVDAARVEAGGVVRLFRRVK